MNVDVSLLPDNPVNLKETIIELQTYINKKETEHKIKIEILEEEVAYWRKKLFNPKSEKHTEYDEQQGRLFNEIEYETTSLAKEIEEIIRIPEHNRKKRGRKPLPENLPRKEVIHDIPEKDKICDCGSELLKIGEEVSEKIDIIPAQVIVVKNIRYKYTCKSCEGLESNTGTIKIAPVPEQILPKSLATPGLLSYLLIAKFCDGLPFYRIEKILFRMGIELSRQTRSGTFLKDMLSDYTGYIQSDAYAGYNILLDITTIILAACWAQVRRKFFDAAKASKKKGSAHAAVLKIKGLYKIEKLAKINNLTQDELLGQRQRYAVPILNDFKDWLDARVHSVPPKSLLGKAINYALSIWDRLLVYTTNPLIPIDNNWVENIIRPFVIGRKAWLFSDTPKGAYASSVLYSLIENAKANKIEPYWYLRYLFEKIMYAETEEDFKALLPQYVDKTQIKTV
jgi:transposase